MYNYFLETLEGKETFEGKHYFRKPDDTYSYIYIKDGKLIVSGGDVEMHAIDICNVVVAVSYMQKGIPNLYKTVPCELQRNRA